MKLATAEDMRRIDDLAVRDHGLTVASLMEAAGAAVVRSLEKNWKAPQRRSVAVLCGKGNNGGDGLAAARLLKKKKVRVEAFLFGRPEDLTREAFVQYQKALSSKVPVRTLEGPEDLEVFSEGLSRCGVLLDALFGTGLSRKVEGMARDLLLAAKASGIPVLAVDVPSGMSSDTGEDLGRALPAQVTVTFGLAKTGFYSKSGAGLCGKVEVAPIGFPSELLSAGFLAHEWTQASEVASYLPRYDDFIHKGTRGRLLVVAGSTGLTGAAVLCALAAQRIGAGLVTVACPRSVNAILETKLTEPMTAPMPEIEGGFLSPEALGPIQQLAQKADAVVLGPGIGRNPGTGRLVQDLVTSLSVPMVLDADALNLLGGQGEILHRTKAPWVVTPHPGEAAGLLKISVPEVELDRAKVAGQIARGYNATAVLKGRYTLIADPAGWVRWNPTGNRSLATGGTGDVLSGVIGGLLAQGLPPFQAALSGVYLHGLAGEAAGREMGPDGMLAGDLLPYLPPVLRGIKEGLREPR